MRERVVRGLSLRLRQQEAGADRGAKVVRQRIGTVASASPGASARRPVAGPRLRHGRAIADPRPDRPQVAQAEAPAEDRGVAERSRGAGRESRGTAIDERPHRGRDEAGGVATEPPLAVDLLEGAGVAVRARQLLDDERHALGLDVHGGRGRGLDRTAEDALQELGRLDGAEPAGPQPPDEPHPLHVRDEVDGLGDRCELVRPDRQEQEDRPVGVAPDHIAEQPQGVVVRPLDVVDEQRDRAGCPRGSRSRRPRGRRRAGAWHPVTGSRTRVRRAPRWPRPPGGPTTSAGVPAAVLLDGRGSKQAARDEERPADLLVGRDRDAREARRRRELAAASSNRVLPMPGSPSSVTAARRLEASRSSWEIPSSSALRPMTAPFARRSWTASEHWGPTSGSSTPPPAPDRHAGLDRPHAV